MNLYLKAKALPILAATAIALPLFAQQTDTAYVPFRVNVAATVTAALGNGEPQSFDVTARTNSGADTLKFLLAPTSIRYAGGAHGSLNAPAVMSDSRGNITLRLPTQSYGNAEIALYSVNGKRVMRGHLADASETARNITRRNVAAGVYMLSVKGANGSAFTMRMPHSGGNMNINAAFGIESLTPEKQLRKQAADGDDGWKITVSAKTPNKYRDSVYTLNNIVKGKTNARQDITLVDTSTSVPPTPVTCTPSQRSWSNLKYGPRSRNNMDIKLPGSGNGPWPVIVYIHGGGFTGGSKSVDAPLDKGPNRGYATAAIEYTLMSNSQKAFPEAVEDVLAAIRYLKANASTYCINPDKVVAAGFSAGGYYTAMIAALSGADNHGLDNATLGNMEFSSKVKAAVTSSALTDIPSMNDDVTTAGAGSMLGDHCTYNVNFFGFNPCTASGANAEIVKKASAFTYITAANCANLPPILMQHGTSDNIVPYPQSKRLVEKINQVCPGNVAQYKQDTGGHAAKGTETDIFKFIDDALK